MFENLGRIVEQKSAKAKVKRQAAMEDLVVASSPEHCSLNGRGDLIISGLASFTNVGLIADTDYDVLTISGTAMLRHHGRRTVRWFRAGPER